MSVRKKIVIVDDHRIFREGLSFLISQMQDYEIAGEASDGASFLRLIDAIIPDIVLMDIAMPVMNGVEASSVALKKYPQLKIVILSMSCEMPEYQELVRAGVLGFILKDSGKDELCKAMESVVSGQGYYSQKLLQKMIACPEKRESNHDQPVPSGIKLTSVENEVLRLLCLGYSINFISEKLSISIRMVESCKMELLEKTGSKNHINLAVFAMKNHLVDF
jgi:DNA-binding NarL/FixJ family response regulator